MWFGQPLDVTILPVLSIVYLATSCNHKSSINISLINISNDNSLCECSHEEVSPLFGGRTRSNTSEHLVKGRRMEAAC